jgi:predicted RNA-binding Zn-ribbon protein involved in translation (DUF1610 family)
VIAEYRDHVERCGHCGRPLAPGPAPRASQSEPIRDQWQELVPVASFAEVHLAYAALAALRAAGIAAEVRDDHYAGLAWHHAIAVGGARVLVPPDDLDAARELLGGAASADVEAAAAASRPADQVCPGCGSREIRRTQRPVPRVLAALGLGGLHRFFHGTRYSCPSCGAQYTP